MELLEDKNVIKVAVEGDEKPYSTYGKYYMRSADEDREISPQQYAVCCLVHQILSIPLNHKRNLERGLAKTAAKIIDSHDGKILELMKENSNINVSEISRLVGLGTTTVTKRIHHMKEEGIVDRKGSKKTGQWIVKG